MSDVGLRTGQVAEAAGVSVQTLRYYERRGLVEEPDRTLGGHRLYPPETVTVLMRARVTAKLIEVEAKLADLAVIRDTLYAARDADCDDLIACADSPCCPLPFVELAAVAQRPP